MAGQENQGLAEMMNEEQQGQQEEEQQEQEQEEQDLQQQEQEQNQREAEAETSKALHDGWVEEEDWVASGKPKHLWVNAAQFNKNGSLMGQIKALNTRLDRQQQETETRLDNQKRFIEMQNKGAISDLEGKRDSAIEDADVAEANRIQGQIDERRANTSEPAADETAATGKPKEIVAWEKANAWINDDNSPKAAYAIQRWNVYAAQGKDVSQALDAVDADIAKAFPAQNPNRQNAPAQESNRSKPGRRAEKKLTWGELSREEEKYYLPDAWKSKDEYLQAVLDARNS